MTYPLHPACAAWPQMDESALADLANDIKANGLIEPIVLLDGQILDGRNRALACERAGVEPRYVDFDGPDPTAFSISKNQRRRHIMSKAQLALIGDTLATLKHGSNQHLRVDPLARGSSLEKTQDEVASDLGVSSQLVQDARAFRQHAAPNLVQMVESGAVGLKNATCFARHTPKEEQVTADVATVKKRGALLRTPCKLGLAPGRPAKAKSPAVKSKRVEIPFGRWPKFTEEIDPNGPHVQLHAFRAKKLLDAEARIGELIQGFIRIAGEHSLEPEAFYAEIDAMLAHQRERDRVDGMQIDFAAKARRHLATLDAVFGKAAARIEAFGRLKEAREAAERHRRG